MKKLNLAIIGQGRSGKDIHGTYYLSKDNLYYDVKYVVERDVNRQPIAAKMYPGCTVVSDYKELLDHKDIDLFVNASYSYMHYPITKDLLAHGFNVLCEKPFGATAEEAQDLIDTAKANNVVVACFHNSLYAPYYIHAKEVLNSGILGHVSQITLRWNGFKRRWDWQTLQKMVAGNAYNTGPHPIGIALDFLDYDPTTKVVFSKLETTALSSGDSDDYTKIILVADNKPVVDIEMSDNDMSQDAYVKIQGDHGNYKSNIFSYTLKYYTDEENPKKPVVETSLMDEEFTPKYCSEKLVFHEVSQDYVGTAFDAGCAGVYEDVYYAITEGRPMRVQGYMGREVVRVIDEVHKQNPLAKKF